jgi:hypothetical protein
VRFVVWPASPYRPVVFNAWAAGAGRLSTVWRRGDSQAGFPAARFAYLRDSPIFDDMQQPNNAAQQDEKLGNGGLNWRQRKKLVARRKALEEESAARKPQLMDAYVAALGEGVRANPIIMLDVERAADLVLMAAEMRVAVRLGTAKVADLGRLEGHADRAVRRLNLPGPSKVSRYGKAEPVPTLQDYFANQQGEDE